MISKKILLFMRVAFRNIFRNKKRSLSAIFTVSVGATALMIFQGFNYGITNQYRDNTIKSKYGNGQLNTIGYRETVYERPWDHWIKNPIEIENQLRKIDSVKYVFPRITFYSLLNNGEINIAGVGEGINGIEESKFFTMLSFVSGDIFSDQQDAIILGKGLARALKVNVGDRVTVLLNNIYGSLNGGDFIVSGIFNTGIQEFDDRYFRIQLSEAQKLLDTQDVESIAVGLKEVSDWDSFAKNANKLFPNLVSTSFEVLDQVFYGNAVKFLDAQFGFIRGIILFIVFLGIFNTVSSSVLERAGEIGTLRANGEYGHEVATVIFIEHIFLGVIGVIIGITLAFISAATIFKSGIAMPASPGITKSFHIILEMKWWHIPGIFAGGIATTIIGAIFPTMKLVRMPITKLLRFAGY